MNKNLFSEKFLKKFFKEIKKRGDTILFKEFKKNKKKAFFIRHDIDLDLLPAQQMSYLENKIGIKSTFFIMVSSKNYNIHSVNNKNILLNILKQGHEIGLHFDSSIYNSNFLLALESEAKVLEDLIGNKISTFSIHNPSITKKFLNRSKYLSAYDKNVFDKRFYLSDSRMLFLNKNPIQFLDKIQISNLQILLHPMHYFSKNMSYKFIFKDFIKRRLLELYSEFKVNKTFKKQLSPNFKNIITFKE